MKNSILSAIALMGMIACQSPAAEKVETADVADRSSTVEKWRGQLHVANKAELPFTFTYDGEAMVMTTGDEVITLDSMVTEGDSTSLYFPVFRTYFKVAAGENEWNGYWYKLDVPGYKIPFTAQRGINTRFDFTANPEAEFDSKWEVTLRAGTDRAKSAVGEFSFTNEGIVTGTFATETGDYRIMQGYFDGKDLKLSGFDGGSAYLFTATLKGDQLIGEQYSGLAEPTPWTAVANPEASLTDPTKLTSVNGEFTGVQFELPNVNGDFVSYESVKGNGPVILQIMGSWCHNCMDETRYFNEMYSKYQKDGLQIIGLSFERYPEFEKSQPAVAKMVADLNMKYPVLFGGAASGDRVLEVLPFLDQLRSYPTTIIINKEGEIVQIHTGFAGPSTSAYADYTHETEELIQSLL